MEYKELKLEERIEAARANLKNFESQHAGFVADLERHDTLLKKLDSGKWNHWDTRLKTQRETEWKNAQKAARANIDTAEAMMELTTETLKYLEDQVQPEGETKEKTPKPAKE